ncbi:hypothetical protein ABK040_008760 [Willaertia magna]
MTMLFSQLIAQLFEATVATGNNMTTIISNQTLATPSTIVGCALIDERGYSFVPWIHKVFGQCIYSPLQQASFYLGLFSFLCWVIALVPQLIKNYYKREAKGLSVLLLIQWMIGDASNFLGTLLSGQLFTQIVLSGYFLVMDCLLISQFIIFSEKVKSCVWMPLFKQIRKLLGLKEKKEINNITSEKSIMTTDNKKSHINEEEHHDDNVNLIQLQSNNNNLLSESIMSDSFSTTNNESYSSTSSPEDYHHCNEENHPIHSANTMNALTTTATSNTNSSSSSSTSTKLNIILLPIILLLAVTILMTLLFTLTLFPSSSFLNNNNNINYASTISRKLLSTVILEEKEEPNYGNFTNNNTTSIYHPTFNFPPKGFKAIFGYAIGSFAACFFISSRIPQIIQNFKLKSEVSTSIPIFIFAIIGNLAQGLSIFIYSVHPTYLLSKLPWIIAGVMNLGLDSFIITQVIVYRYLYWKNNHQPPENRAPRLNIIIDKENIAKPPCGKLEDIVGVNIIEATRKKLL